MRLFFTFLCVLLSLVYSFGQSCLPNGITLNTQEEIDNFAANYPGCTEIIGTVLIGTNSGGWPVSLNNLNGLSQITAIGGDLRIRNTTDLYDLSGLNNLTTVGDDLGILDNEDLSSLEGLENLSFVNDNVTIYQNNDLGNFLGLNGLETIGGGISISNNSNLNNLSGFNNIDSLSGIVEIKNNQMLYEIEGFNNLIKLDILAIDNNNNLTNIAGFNNIEKGSIEIIENDNLSSLLILNNITELDGSINFSYNGQLVTLNNSFNNLTSISGGLSLQYNVALTDVNLLPINLTSVGKLTIKGGNFEDMSAFSNLIEIEEIYISINDNFTNLNGLQSIDTLTTLEIEYCDSLVNLNGLNNLHHIRDRLVIRLSENLTDISALSNLHHVGGSFLLQSTDELTSLQGLENLQEVGGALYITNHGALTDMTGLSGVTIVGDDLLISRNDAMNSFSGLDELRVVRGALRVTHIPLVNNLSGLADIDSIGGLSIGYNDNMTSLTGMDAALNGYIFISSNPSLVNINGMENFDIGQIDEIRIWGNDILNNLEGLEQITSVEGDIEMFWNPNLTSLNGLNNLGYASNITITNNDALINMNGLDNLDTILLNLTVGVNLTLNDFTGLEDLNFVRRLIINNNTSLTSLTGLDNINPSDVINCEITNNDNLYNCGIEPICNYLVGSMGNISISDNASGCNGQSEVLFTCSGLARILSQTFYDANQNKIQDGQEPYYTDASLLIEPQNVYFSPNNDYVFWLDVGSYTVSYNQAANPDWQLTTDSASYFIQLTDNQSESIIFGVYPAQEISEVKTFITSPPARCNTPVTFDLTAKNVGTTVASGMMWMQFDDNIISIMPENSPDTITDLGFYGWHFTDLYPSESITEHITLDIPGPPDFPVGDFLHFLAFTDYDDVNGMHTSEGFRYDTEVRCSFDPNDKLINPNRYHYETLLDEDIIYTIRFQNTGNDVAYDVTILDTLDMNLDWSTFRVLGSSHSEVLNTSLNNEGIITFDFPNIFLPDSTSNLEGSNGHVTYMIRALDGIDENTVIRNSAGIYFDQNPPVITNTTLSVMVSMLTSTATPDDLFPDLTILPNPNTGIFQVEGIPRGTYNLLNTKGQRIQSGQLENGTSINISEAAQGVYFIQMMIDEQMVTRRVVKL